MPRKKRQREADVNGVDHGGPASQAKFRNPPIVDSLKTNEFIDGSEFVAFEVSDNDDNDDGHDANREVCFENTPKLNTSKKSVSRKNNNNNNVIDDDHVVFEPENRIQKIGAKVPSFGVLHPASKQQQQKGGVSGDLNKNCFSNTPDDVGFEEDPNVHPSRRIVEQKEVAKKPAKVIQKLDKKIFSLKIGTHGAAEQCEFFRQHLFSFALFETAETAPNSAPKALDDKDFVDIQGNENNIYKKALLQVLTASDSNKSKNKKQKMQGQDIGDVGLYGITKSSLRKNGPLVIVVCMSGIRCMDVIRELRLDEEAHRNVCVAKLFAKHLKLSDQEAFLQTNAVHVAVGTPDRIAKLCESGSLKTGNVRAVFVDASFQDKTKRSVFTNPETRHPFFNLYRTHLESLFKAVVDQVDPKKTQNEARITRMLLV